MTAVAVSGLFSYRGDRRAVFVVGRFMGLVIYLELYDDARPYKP